MRTGMLRGAVLLAAAPLVAGCHDPRFTTRSDEAYCGAITLGSPFRAGLSPRVQMRLTLDVAALETGEAPGRLSTFEAATDERPERRLFDDALLRPIPPLAHDPLSHFEMGDGRERNTLYAISPSEPPLGAMLAFLSLRSDGGVEVRLLRPGAEEEGAGEEGRLIFGLFSLVRREGRCGF